MVDNRREKEKPLPLGGEWGGPLQAANHAQRSEQSGQGGDYHLDDGLNDFLLHLHFIQSFLSS